MTAGQPDSIPRALDPAEAERIAQVCRDMGVAKPELYDELGARLLALANTVGGLTEHQRADLHDLVLAVEERLVRLVTTPPADLVPEPGDRTNTGDTPADPQENPHG